MLLTRIEVIPLACIKMFVLGLKVGSAVPLSQAKVMALLAYVDQRASKAPTALACICCLQDYLCFLFCWLSCMRGKDSGKLEMGDLFVPRARRYRPACLPAAPHLPRWHRGRGQTQRGQDPPQ